ncbi:MAG: hypothetical protein IJU28_04720 [Clostridia bacterium]|nr:hypothetical protein [Clostridia bacterium]
MATRDKGYDSFRRGEKREGGKHSSYTKNVSRAAAIKGKALMTKSVKDVLFCLLLPPYGIYRVWTQEKNQPVFKISCTLLSMLIMFLWFLLIIPENKPEQVEVPRVRATAIQQ